MEEIENLFANRFLILALIGCLIICGGLFALLKSNENFETQDTPDRLFSVETVDSPHDPLAHAELK